MEAIIRTDDKDKFFSLLQFLRSLDFQIEEKDEDYSKKKKKFSIFLSSAIPVTNFRMPNRDERNER